MAYPVYDLLSRNPEFFVARQSQAGDIGLVVLVLSFALPFALFGLQAVLARIVPLAFGTIRSRATYLPIVLPFLDEQSESPACSSRDGSSVVIR